MEGPRRAVVLLSGGLDSATTLAVARNEGFEAYAMSFAYGQRQAVELDAARRVAAWLGVQEHRVIPIDLRSFGGSALTDTIAVPKNRSNRQMSHDIPVTYVPARNTIFLSYALAWAEVLGSFDIFVGVNAVDYSGYPDCRPEFVAAFEKLANLATKAGIEGDSPFRIHTPLIDLKKAQIIQRGIELGVNFADTHSCYDPVGDLACGKCDSCQLRARGFTAAGVKDPTRYYQPSMGDRPA